MDDDLRNCGGCSLCCIVMAIPELNKKAGEDCEHRTDGGCSIYADRCGSCRSFNCLWKFKKMFKDRKARKRPDKTGIVSIPKKEMFGHSPAVHLIARAAKTFKTQDVKTFTDNLRDKGFTVAQSVAGSETSWLLKARLNKSCLEQRHRP